MTAVPEPFDDEGRTEDYDRCYHCGGSCPPEMWELDVDYERHTCCSQFCLEQEVLLWLEGL